MKKAPLLFLIIITTSLFTILAFLGGNTVYAEESHDLETTPILAKVFTGINSDIYPWNMLNHKKTDVIHGDEPEVFEAKEELDNVNETVESDLEEDKATDILEEEFAEEIVEEEIVEEIVENPVDKLTGLELAASYPFKKISSLMYFDNALFIGDSRTVGLRKYTDLPEHADFLCITSMGVFNVLKSNFKGQGSVEETLKNKEYGKVYIMLGVNELGSGKTEDYVKAYGALIDKIREISPKAKIIIQATMNIDKARSDSDKIYNNENIRIRNEAIASFVDNEHIFYIDVNEVLCDEEGYLRDDLKGDHVHLKASSYQLWKDFLLEHGV